MAIIMVVIIGRIAIKALISGIIFSSFICRPLPHRVNVFLGHVVGPFKGGSAAPKPVNGDLRKKKASPAEAACL